MMFRVFSPLICRPIAKQSNPSLRKISFIQNIRPRSVLLDKSKHKLVYEFPYIIPMSYLIRTKFWVPSLMTVVTPIGLLFDEIRFTILGGLVSSWLHYAVVHGMSKFAQHTIGKIYVNKENESEDVIVSSVDVCGNRIDRYHKPTDFIVCDFSTKFSQSMGFIKIFIDNSEHIYQLNVINCKVHDQKSYTSLLGSKWTFQKNENKSVQ